MMGIILVYKKLTIDQHITFGELGLLIIDRVKSLSKPQAFRLVFKLIEYFEKHFSP
jgi:hypothetical protein